MPSLKKWDNAVNSKATLLSVPLPQFDYCLVLITISVLAADSVKYLANPGL